MSTGHLLGDTTVRTGQSEALKLAWGCMPEENVIQCMHLLRESDDLAEAAKAKAAEALLMIDAKPSDEKLKEQHKAVKNNLRNCYTWRSAGCFLDMDLGAETMEKVWKDTAT